jgi:hypothetical protein
MVKPGTKLGEASDGDRDGMGRALWVD